MSRGKDLFDASCFGDVKKVRQILSTDGGVNVEHRGTFACTSLIRASQNGHIGVVQELLAHHADVNAFDYMGDTALHYASGGGRADCVAALLQQPHIQMYWQNEDGNSALHHACSNDHLTVVEILLNAGPDTHQLRNKTGQLPVDRFRLPENAYRFKQLLHKAQKPTTVNMHYEKLNTRTQTHVLQKNVLDMSLNDSEAEGLSAETGDRQFLLLEKLQKLLLPAAEKTPSSAQARPQGDQGFESKLQEVQTLLKQKNVLDMSLNDSEAEGLSAETGDRQFLLLEKLQKLLLPAAEQSPSSAQARPQGVKGFESKLQEVQTLLKQELHTTSNQMDRKTLKHYMDVLASMAKDQKESSLKINLTEQLEELFTEHRAKLGIHDDSYHFENSVIRHNYEALVEDIYPDDVLDHLYSSLLSRDEYERIRAQVTTRDKNRLLLVKLDERGEEGVKELCKALSSTPQAHLAGLLLKK